MSIKKKKILVVEDEETLASVYAQLLKEHGYAPRVATSGQEGVDQIKKGGWDLILLDIMMPKIDGLEVLGQLAPEDRAKNGPIIMLTVLAQETIVAQALKAGASGYIIKSDVDFGELLKIVNEFLEN